MNENNVHLTSGEIASLWTAYMNDSMSKCILDFMLKHIEDQDIKPIIQQAHDISMKHMEQLTAIFESEQFAIPNGFTEQDVNMNAPWLFTDVFCLTYVNHMAKVGMLAYSGFVSMSARQDITSYFSKGLAETNQLFQDSLKIALQKGTNARHPYIEVPKRVEYVDSKKYLSGLNPLSNKRPLNSVEISHLYMNIITNSTGIKLCLAFAQTSPTKDVQDFMIRGKDISQKHIKIFVDTLLKDDIEAPHVPDVGVSESTASTFSDKLMMFHMSLLISSGIGNYSTAGSASQRSDLMVNYERLSFEVARLAKSGADIMIQNNWLEQPPGVKDREKLARSEEKS
ncbi:MULTISPECIES: DUF3231 family protein [Virgibacillus]|uniref:DUF3231 family protein n=2 Tax=Virgibacillus TaxID=84406 RepID=A0A024Q9G1_9BACI|nr:MULTISPECIES: DUF3231 family protein [Virgibacillus]EQB37911.1 hypothetical protein M948_04920 [Virgibacillus sp. CM-4]MYL40634.1 DUF3231 family protein [Virgibacillus massiliensis]GGJ73304.1 hypothetical protein GCM10007111_38600 [Virgibacillus kapii]CDQ38561.1 hypothetical protein BN990_00832 [Virgibacillus massiliensis]